MTGWNMPLGCCNADIPGFSSPEETRSFCKECQEPIDFDDFDEDSEMCFDCKDVALTNLRAEVKELSQAAFDRLQYGKKDKADRLYQQAWEVVDAIEFLKREQEGGMR